MIRAEILTPHNDPIREIEQEVMGDISRIKAQVDALASETAKQMKQVIVDNKKRPQSDEPTELEAAIYEEYFDDGWGVGDVDYMNQTVGYWAAVNWGSSHMVGRRVPNGYFAPGQPNPTPDAFRQGRWKVGDLDDTGHSIEGGETGLQGAGQGHWSFIVGQAIPPMNYIEKTGDWLDSRLDEVQFTL